MDEKTRRPMRDAEQLLGENDARRRENEALHERLAIRALDAPHAARSTLLQRPRPSFCERNSK